MLREKPRAGFLESSASHAGGLYIHVIIICMERALVNRQNWLKVSHILSAAYKL